MIIVMIILSIIITTPKMIGGALSPRLGSVDLLQLPKQTIMFGYRFQNPLLPVEPWNQRSSTPALLGYGRQPTDAHTIQRVGVFKSHAYVDDNPILETFENASSGAVAQLRSIGEQNRYLNGHPGDPIEKSLKPFSPTAVLASPIKIKDHPNPFFSWGDVYWRYNGQFTLT